MVYTVWREMSGLYCVNRSMTEDLNEIQGGGSHAPRSSDQAGGIMAVVVFLNGTLTIY